MSHEERRDAEGKDATVSAPTTAKSAKRYLIVGGSPEAPSSELLRRLVERADEVIACDHGADACCAAHVAPQVLVGDNDSLTPEGLAFARVAGAEELDYPMDKDEVDLSLAIKAARARGAATIVFTGVSGGRPDHALAVLGCAVEARDLSPVIEENGFACHILAGDAQATWELACEDADVRGCTLSVIALAPHTLVTERGMRWETSRLAMPLLSDRGISNIVERADARVTVDEGAAAVYLLRAPIEKRSLV